jgi:vacuolar-type H+-ATPase subunit H
MKIVLKKRSESKSENSDHNESEKIVDEDEDEDKKLLDEVIDASKTIVDEKYDNCVKDGLDEEEACQQSNDDITRVVKREFYKRYTTYLKLAVHLENSNVHE